MKLYILKPVFITSIFFNQFPFSNDDKNIISNQNQPFDLLYKGDNKFQQWNIFLAVRILKKNGQQETTGISRDIQRNHHANTGQFPVGCLETNPFLFCMW